MAFPKGSLSVFYSIIFLCKRKGLFLPFLQAFQIPVVRILVLYSTLTKPSSLKKITISIESKKLAGTKSTHQLFGCKLLLRDCTYRANACTCTAIQASVSVNVELTFALRNCANRALACTGTAGNAVIADFVSHCVLLFLRIK